MFSPEQIRELIDGRPIVADFAYGKSDAAAVNALHRNACREVEKQTLMSSRIEWDRYGSGHASFTDAWFYREEPGWAGPVMDAPSWCGLGVLLSRLSPYFVFMEGFKSWSDGGEASYHPEFGAVDLITTPVVADAAPSIQRVLEQQGLIRLHASDLDIDLDPQIHVPTVLSRPGRQVEFDALFYWED